MSLVLRGATVASTVLFALGAATTAHAAGFQLKEQSAEGLGHAFAGMTAKADSYDTVFYNTAGMTRLETGMSGNASYLMPYSKFSDGGSSRTGAGAPMGSNPSGDAIDDALLPSLYAVWKINPDWALGLAVNVPYGLVTDYDSNWIGRYHALKSDLETISVQPALAYKVTDQLSLGAGLNIQHTSAELTKAVDFTALGGAGDGYSKLEGSETALGYTLSALYEVDDATRVGVHYRSRVRHDLDGNITFSNKSGPFAGAAAFRDGGATAEFITPDSANLGIYHDITDEWAIMGDIAWTNWSLFRSLTIVRDDGTIASSKYENWDDSWFYSLGAAYSPAELDGWTFTAGVAYDQSPVPDATRTPRVPDSDRTWLSGGVSYAPSEDMTFSLGYTHIFAKKASINDTEALPPTAATYTLTGSYDSHVDIVSVGMNYTF